ncbi:hypothetical protein NDN13_14490 [Acinetobacter sp. C32I]|uniref:hypothetical protein n=1 Tax=Acinetobacter sp. C32I TaxID=2950074 RepID=UPI00203684FA|nr:hypothetical protein [Acinetobacter sp. C32I]USA52660.1 hypothetical protein NDN13_14490 [Acinetobacter sp. C32I]
MSPENAVLIQEFFNCTSKLLKAGIVRSDKILGDIGERLCVEKYGLVLETSGRHPGYDGKIGTSRVQVKVHNSPEGTNLNVGDPDKYDELIVILGPRSRLRVSDVNATFHTYRFPSDVVKHLMKRASGYYCGKRILQDSQLDIILLET